MSNRLAELARGLSRSADRPIRRPMGIVYADHPRRGLMAGVAALWESGAKRPSGMALKLLAVVDKQGLKALT